MSLTRYGIVLLSTLVLAVQGCGSGSTEKPPTDKGQAKQSVFDLHAQLAQARDEVQREREGKENLQAQVQSLTQKIGQLQAEMNRAQTQGARKEASGATDQSRIQLIGEKALVEYKAEQLSRRLNKLSEDLDRKEGELESLRNTAQAREKEVADLKRQIDSIQTAEKSRSAALTTRVDQITKELEERSVAAKKLKQELDEKSELLNTFKTAISDANKLKTAADSESSRLQGELDEVKQQLESSTQQFASTQQQLEASQQQLEASTQQLEASQQQLKSSKQQLEEAQQRAVQWYQEAERRGQEAKQRAEESTRWAQEADRYRSLAEAASKDVEELKARAEELSGRLQAVEGEAESPKDHEPSPIDRLLTGPKAEEPAAPKTNLY